MYMAKYKDVWPNIKFLLDMFAGKLGQACTQGKSTDSDLELAITDQWTLCKGLLLVVMRTIGSILMEVRHCLGREKELLSR